VTLNLSKSGGSLSFGPRGAKFTVGSRSKRAMVGIPGTGLFYTSTLPSEVSGGRRNTSSAATEVPSVRAEDRLTLGFFKRLVTPDDEEALVDGCRELLLGNEDKALEYFKNAVHLADGAYLAGFLALKQDRLKEAANYLATAAEKHSRLGRYFSKYGISATMSLPITDEVSTHVGPDLRGVLLGLVEVYQRQERWRDAIACLERLLRIEPDDVMVKLSLAELLLNAHPGDKKVCRKVVRLVEGIENETPIHAALMLYKAKALRHLGLGICFGRSGMNGLWSMRISVGTDGHVANSRSSYTEEQYYENVAVRLGL